MMMDGQNLTKEEEDNDKTEYDSDATVPYPFPTCPYMPGDIVLVEHRTWPGTNKPGGVGRLLRVDETTATATVSYVIGRKRTEDLVPFEFMEEYKLEPRKSRVGNSRVGNKHRNMH